MAETVPGAPRVRVQIGGGRRSGRRCRHQRRGVRRRDAIVITLNLDDVRRTQTLTLADEGAGVLRWRDRGFRPVHGEGEAIIMHHRSVVVRGHLSIDFVVRVFVEVESLR